MRMLWISRRPSIRIVISAIFAYATFVGNFQALRAQSVFAPLSSPSSVPRNVGGASNRFLGKKDAASFYKTVLDTFEDFLSFSGQPASHGPRVYPDTTRKALLFQAAVC